MDAQPPSDFAGEVLLKEYERLCTDIRSIEAANEKILGLGFTLIGLAATAGIYQHVAPIFFVLPLAVVGIITYASVSYLCIYSMGGYKQHLEDQLNEIAGQPVLLWERLVRHRERSSVNGHLLRIIYLIISVSIFILSIIQISASYSLLAAYGMALLLLFLVGGSAIGFRQMTTIFDRTYAKAQRLRRG